MSNLPAWHRVIAVIGLLVLANPSANAAEPVIDFNRQIRPLLSDNCFACHGPDEATRKGGLRLDTKDGMFAETTNSHAIEPGKSMSSEAFQRMISTDPKKLMPPTKSGKQLKPEQIALIKAWIDQGAKWSAHWAFEAPIGKIPPLVKHDGFPIRNPIDAFIMGRLVHEKLNSSPEASKETLIRRLSLDLTGLPPTIEEIDAFVKDTSPQAYERVVDRLLASPAYGERMAMPWLDGARYADSNGYQTDFERFMWPWRDWVIKAFNDNMPFDQFTIEQIAGDMLPNATLQQKIASGFNRNHRINGEGGIIPEEWRIETVIDRVETTSSVWLGLTVGCARCHDHKYDPLSQREFYQLFAFFNNVPESGHGGDSAVNTPPVIRAPRAEDLAKLNDLDHLIALQEEKAKLLEAKLPAMLAEWEKTALTKNSQTTWKIVAQENPKAANGAKLTVQPDMSIHVSGGNPTNETYTLPITIPANTTITGFRLDVLNDDANPMKYLGRSANGNFVMTDLKLEADGKVLKIATAKADFSQVSYPIEHAIDDLPGTGWAIHPKVSEPRIATFALATPFKSDKPTTLLVTIQFQTGFAQHQFSHFRTSITDSNSPHDKGGMPPGVTTALQTPADKRTPAQGKELTNYFRTVAGGEWAEADKAVIAAKKAKTDYEAKIPTVMVMQEMPQTRDAFVLVRGQYDRKGDKVTAKLPSALLPMPDGAPANRLGFAQWMMHPQHPLTARVAVNRYWEKFFGTGLVKSTENFGLQGDAPTHPELLDWLALEFISLKWDMKAIQKTIVMSSVYRQSSKVTPELMERDPENRLLARGPRFRLQGEMVRDNALAISGLLVNKVGGPSVRPYQPLGVWDETNNYGNLRNYQHDKGEGLYRRSMYTIWKRTAAPPSMLIFDSATREVCAVRRARTNTPLQALALLNEVTYVESARMFATKMMSNGSTPDERIEWAFRRATSRKPTPAELKLLVGGFQRRLTTFRANPDAAKKLLAIGEQPLDTKLDAIELAAYTTSASVILNLDETITKE